MLILNYKDNLGSHGNAQPDPVELGLLDWDQYIYLLG